MSYFNLVMSFIFKYIEEVLAGAWLFFWLINIIFKVGTTPEISVYTWGGGLNSMFLVALIPLYIGFVLGKKRGA